MRKNVAIAAGLLVLSTSAFATKSRLNALGQGTNGSHYISDTRNVFENPASINTMNNYAVMEWGTDLSSPTVASSSTPQAEGGFFREMGAFAYGVYLGNNGSNNNVRTGGSVGGTLGSTNQALTGTIGESGFLEHDNGLDLFIGGDAGVEWGARLHYAKNKDERGTFTKEQSALGLGLGMMMGDISAYANIDLKDESEGASQAEDKWEADTGLNLGVGYDFMGYKVFVDYDKSGAEYQNGTATFKANYERTDFELGVGRIHEVSSSAKVFMDVSLMKTSIETKATSSTGMELKQTRLPLTIGFETEATSWLSLRGSVSQNFLIGSDELATTPADTTNDGKVSRANSTEVAAGATLNFGKLKVDGMIGTDGDNRGAGTDKTNEGVLSTDNLLTYVGVSYWF